MDGPFEMGIFSVKHMQMDNRLVHRATVLREWMGTESYALVQAMLKEVHAQRMDMLVTGTKEQFDQNVGHIMGLTEAIRLAEQTILDEVRQRPQEVSHAR